MCYPRKQFLGLVGLGLAAGQLLSARELYVAKEGFDGWSGTLRTPNAARSDGPLATLDRARDVIRASRSVPGTLTEPFTVTVQRGLYPLEKPFLLAAEDSGTAEAPVVYRAAPGQEVRIVGGKVVPTFVVVTDPTVLSRLDESARGKVLQANLRELGISEFGSAAGGGLEVFFDDRPMPLARWPNSGFTRIIQESGPTPVDVRGTKGCVEGAFTYDGDRPRRWAAEKDIWLHGYWFWDWADQRQKVAAIDLAQRRIDLQPPYHGYGYRKGQWYYAYNLLAELDEPGEWYLDRETGVLYFWPPSAINRSSVVVSLLPTLMTLNNVAHVSVEGFILEAARATAFTIANGRSNRVVGCTLRNLGGVALTVTGGSDHAVVGCDVSECGAGGIALSGGDRKTLLPARHFADNNHIHHYGRWQPMYSAGLSLAGVGLKATHNLIDNAPHQAISFSGNDHRIERNEIHSVCFESNDAGAIYAGRDWTMRGTTIANNYLHDITGFEGRGCVGVYLDDMYCGTEIVGNLFVKVTRAAFVGGGRDCRIEGNVFVDCNPAIHVDARALGWAKYHADEWVKEGHEKGTLSGVEYRNRPYSERYPELVQILQENPWAPKGNLIRCNIRSGGRWDEIESQARPFLTAQDNLVDQDPHFQDRSRRDFRLLPDSPAFRLGFQEIPFERIGLYQDIHRASWPVRSEIRPVTAGLSK